MRTPITPPHLHTYAAVYNGQTKEIQAGSLYDAKLKAVEHFKVPRSRQSQVGVYLVRTHGGEAVNIVPQTF